MQRSRLHPSPALDEFLAVILDDHDLASGAAFAAAMLEDHNLSEGRAGGGRRTTDISHEGWLNAILYGVPEPTHAFAFGTLREYNFDPNQPRDERGRWTTGASKGKSPEQARQDILKALAPKGPAPVDESAARADDNSAIFGKRKFANRDGSKTFDARFAGFDPHGRVLLRKPGEQGPFVAAAEFFSDEDKQFLADLAKLRNDEGFMVGLYLTRIEVTRSRTSET